MNTGKEFTYQNFELSNPDNFRNNEICVELRREFNYQCGMIMIVHVNMFLFVARKQVVQKIVTYLYKFIYFSIFNSK